MAEGSGGRRAPFGRARPQLPPFRSLSANERAIVALLRAESPLSRAELARRTGLALPTISRLCDQLTRESLIEADARVMMSQRGQPSLPLSLCADAAFAFGVTIRADAIGVVLVDLLGYARGEIVEPIKTLALESVTRRLTVLTTRLVREAGVPPDRVAGIGLALPGFFVLDPPRVNAPLGMEDWAVEALEETLGDSLGLPVSVENDGSAAAIGEQLYGAGGTCRSFAYLYIDRGLGGGIVQAGELVRGEHGNAGEFTGLLHPDERADRPTLALLLEMARAEGVDLVSIADLTARYQPGWPCVERWLARTRSATDALLSAAAALFDPTAIVIGGRAPSDLASRMIAQAGMYSFPVRGRDRPFPKIVASEVEGDAAAFGAAALIFRRYLV